MYVTSAVQSVVLRYGCPSGRRHPFHTEESELGAGAGAGVRVRGRVLMRIHRGACGEGKLPDLPPVPRLQMAMADNEPETLL